MPTFDGIRILQNGEQALRTLQRDEAQTRWLLCCRSQADGFTVGKVYRWYSDLLGGAPLDSIPRKNRRCLGIPQQANRTSHHVKLMWASLSCN